MTHAPATLMIRRAGEDITDVVDRLPADLRACIHEFGMHVVQQYMQAGVTKPATIRRLIMLAYRGARDGGNSRTFEHPGQGVLGIMNDAMRAVGAPNVAHVVVRELRRADMTIIQREPTDDMVEASCSALSNAPIVTYEQKHRLRLRAALRTGDKARWGWTDR